MVRRCAFVLRALSIVMLAGCASRLPAAPPAEAVSVRPAAGFTFQGAFQQGGLVFGTAPEGTVSLFFDGQPLRMAEGRRFLLGFGRDHGPDAVIEARSVDGTVQRQPIAIAARAWDIQSLPTLARGTTPTPEFLKRRAAEVAQINAARTIESDSQGWRQAFVWPVIGRISGVFGSQRIYAGEPGAPHSGVDVARPTGTPVVAPADGVVILAAAAPFSLEGNLLMIDHGMGLNSAFLHLSRIDVKVGDHVARGQRVGAIGATGRATGPHLHWSMKWQDERIDPARLAGPMPGS